MGGTEHKKIIGAVRLERVMPYTESGGDANSEAIFPSYREIKAD
jgi:hypothetical protein